MIAKEADLTVLNLNNLETPQKGDSQKSYFEIMQQNLNQLQKSQ